MDFKAFGDKAKEMAGAAVASAAYNIKREIPDVPLKGVQLDLTMTLPPRVSVSFVNNVVAAA